MGRFILKGTNFFEDLFISHSHEKRKVWFMLLHFVSNVNVWRLLYCDEREFIIS